MTSPIWTSDNPRVAPGAAWYARAAVVAATLAAVTLVACGPRETPVAAGTPPMGAPADPSALRQAGQPVPQATEPAVAVAPAPVPAAPPAPVAPPPTRSAQAPGATHADDPAPAYRPAPTPVAQAKPVASNRIGEITSIEPIRTRPQGSGAGAVVGGVLGAVVGNQFGHGLGRAVLTGAGAVGGALAGNNVERNHKEGISGYRVVVRLDNGRTRVFDRPQVGGLHVGDRVRLDAHSFHRA